MRGAVVLGLLLTSLTTPALSDPMKRVERWKSQARFLFDQRRFAEAEPLLRHLVMSPQSRRDKARLFHDLAQVLNFQGKYTEAERYYRDAMSLYQADHGKIHETYAKWQNNLAGVLRAEGRFAEAEELYVETLAITEKTTGKNSRGYAITLGNIALAIAAQDRLAEAEQNMRQALAIDSATIGSSHPEYAMRLDGLATILQKQNKFSDAEQLYRQAVDITRETLGDAHSQHAQHLNNLAVALNSQGKGTEAGAYYRRRWAARLSALITRTMPRCCLTWGCIWRAKENWPKRTALWSRLATYSRPVCLRIIHYSCGFKKNWLSCLNLNDLCGQYDAVLCGTSRASIVSFRGIFGALARLLGNA